MPEDNIGDAARALSAMRRKELIVCAHCGKEVDKLSYSKYCSVDCSKKADYARHAEERRAARREKYAREKAEKPPATRPPGRPPKKVEG